MITQNEMVCIGCQECCQYVTFTLSSDLKVDLDNMVEYYNARGFKVVMHDTKIEVMIPTTCPQLTKYGCKIYSTRPYACKMYDGRQDPLMNHFCKLRR